MNSEEYEKVWSELANESINQTEIIRLYHEEPNFDTSGLDTSDIIQPVNYTYDIQPVHYPMFGVSFLAFILVIRICLIACRCCTPTDDLSTKTSSTAPVNTLPNCRNREAVSTPNQVFAVIIPTEDVVQQDKAKNLNSSLEKYLRPQTHDDHVINVDQRQALI